MKNKKNKTIKSLFSTISAKITAIYAINIVYIVIIMVTIGIVYNILNTKVDRLNNLNEQTNASLQLKTLFIESSSEILNIIYNKKDDLISHLFARNEDIFSVFEGFKNTAEKNNFTENVSFAKENEPVIMEIRTNIVACINLYREKKTNEAINYYDLKINNKLKQMSQFVSDSINSNNSDIELIKKEISKTEKTIVILLGISFLLIIIINILFGTILKKNILKPIKSLVNMLKDAKGDLTVHLDLNTNDELGEMAVYFNNFIKIIHDMVTNVLISAQKLSTGVQQISNGNQNLSQRSAEQAASLEEIASTLEEAAAAINLNAENAQTASKVSLDTSKIADEGKNIVQLAAEIMNKTKESSKTIGDIISVIDSIAFQTNILALNASIEAARAGEYGHSFAVVAREVKNLAQGSKKAAQEIGYLIKSSVNSIEKGAEFSNLSNEALNKIVDAIKKVEKHISEISTSSFEQKTGIEQINAAVSELDTMTQQNSSLAEETASASEELTNLSGTLLAMVKEFKIEGKNTEKIFLNQASDADNNVIKNKIM